MSVATSLPPIVRLSDHGGVWQDYEDELYRIFTRDFIRGRPLFFGKPVMHKRGRELKGKVDTFWHLTSEGDTEADRVPSISRCERIPWIRPMLEGAPENGVVCWRQKRNGSRVVVALPDLSYAIFLAEVGAGTGAGFVLITAYEVRGEHRKAVHLAEARERPYP